MAEAKANNLWGGRFTGEADSGFAQFNQSFSFDPFAAALPTAPD
jgi:hypothetical protein